jgi:hypothetical protein
MIFLGGEQRPRRLRRFVPGVFPPNSLTTLSVFCTRPLAYDLDVPPPITGRAICLGLIHLRALASQRYWRLWAGFAQRHPTNFLRLKYLKAAGVLNAKLLAMDKRLCRSGRQSGTLE